MFLCQSSLKVIFLIVVRFTIDNVYVISFDAKEVTIFKLFRFWMMNNNMTPQKRLKEACSDWTDWLGFCLEHVSFSVSEQPASWRPRTALTVPGHGSASGRVVVKMVYFIALQNQTKMVNKWVNLPFADGLRFSCDWTIPFSESRGAAKIKLNTLF